MWYGYSVAEALYGREGREVRLTGLPVRSPDRFRWRADGALLLRSSSSPDGEALPDRKFLVVTRDSEHDDVPHGPGLAYWCWWPVEFKRYGSKFWLTALERYGSPVPMGKHPDGALTAQVDQLLSVLSQIATGSSVAIPESQSIELLSANNRAAGDHEQWLRYWDQVISGVVLGQSSTTDQGPWRGTAEVQKDVRDEVVAADARLLDDAVTRTLAVWLTEWNYPGATIPVLHRDAEPPEDLTARARRDQIVSASTGYRLTLRDVQQRYGGEWEPAPAPPPLPPGADPRADGRGGAAFNAADDADAAIEAATDAAAGDWEELVRPVVQPVLDVLDEIILAGADYEAFLARLDDVGLRGRLDPVVERLARTAFSARVSGQVEPGSQGAT